jgi:hypothetical protein
VDDMSNIRGGDDQPDTLAQWLYQRFRGGSAGWDTLGDADRSYWEHEAAAVRRAVARGGFKRPQASGPDPQDLGDGT